MKLGLENSDMRDEIYTQIGKEMDATPDGYSTFFPYISFFFIFLLEPIFMFVANSKFI